MKKVFTLSVFSLLFVSAFSQITLSLSDMPVAGQIQRITIDTLPLPAISFGNKGANQFYDFSNLTFFKNDTILYRTPTSGQLSACPNADVATTLDGVNFLLTNNDPANNKLTLEGFEGLINGNVLNAGYSTKPDLFRFPTTYLTNFAGTGYLQKTVPGSQVGQPLATSVELTINTTYSDTIDGWGRVKTPLGTYDCLRKQRKEITNTVIRALVFGTWQNISNTTSTTIRYTYPTKETKGSAVNFTFDSLNNVTTVSWSLIPPTAPTANFGYTSGGGGLILFSDSTIGYPDSYSWNFGDGTNGNTQNPNHTYTANGAYYVCLTVTNAGGSTQYCDSVYVTGITAANSAPVAVNDAITLTQATTNTTNVGLNDVDPDADNFCLTTVYGSPFVSIAPTGNCTSLLYEPDSTFTGNDTVWYVICDNGSPSLCDTGTVIYTVTADPSLLPVASYTTSNSSIFNCGLPIVNADSTFTVVNTSNNFDTVYWHIKAAGGTCNDSIVEFWTNTVNVTPSQYAAQWGCTNYDTLEICMFVSNQFGWDVKCEIVCNITWSPTGISETSLSNISIYPNPVSNFITIDMSNNQDEITRSYSAVEVFNAVGEKVMAVANNNSKTVQLSLTELPAGIYYASIVDAKGVRRTLGRFMKE